MVLFDGIGTDVLADSLLEGLRAAGRAPVRVSGSDFLRPPGERFEHGHEDALDLRERWLDRPALRREVLDAAATGVYLPALWDARRERSARAGVLPLPPASLLLVDGQFLLDDGPDGPLTGALVVHQALSPAALRRRGVPEWQVPVLADYDAQVRPGEHCDVLVRAEDPLRPAVHFRT